VRKSSRKSRNPKPLGTLAEFAEAANTPLSTVSGWIRNAKWRWKKRAPWPADIVPEVLRWAAEELVRGRPEGTAPVDGEDESKALRKQKLRNEVRKLLASAETAETALARVRGQLVDADEVEREWAGIGVLIRNAMQNIAPQLVPLALSHGMPNGAAAVFRQQIEDIITSIQRRLSSDGPEDDGDGA
jgi:hypothetical protein